MSFTTDQLATEINTDPTSIGYKHSDGTFQDSQIIANLINTVHHAYQVTNTNVTGADVDNVITDDVWASLTAIQLAQLTNAEGVLDGGNELTATILLKFARIFGSTSTTYAAIAALATRDASRAEDLWGAGTSISFTDVDSAKNSL
jgi:hypothetical protein